MITIKVKEEKEIPVREYMIQELAEQIERLKQCNSVETTLAIKDLIMAMAAISG